MATQRNGFTPQLSILPPPQQALWPELSATPEPFVLYGGTAIALRLGHRESVDFDFFSDQAFDTDTLVNTTPYLENAEIYQRAPNTMSCRVDRDGWVKLSYFKPASHSQLVEPDVAQDNGLPVANLRDLAVSKLTVIQNRAELKDYLDLHALLFEAEMSLEEMLLDGHRAYGPRFSVLSSLQALSYFEDGSVYTLPEGMKTDLIEQAKGVNFDRIERSIELIDKQFEDGFEL
jgi:hypothetical protein